MPTGNAEQGLAGFILSRQQVTRQGRTRLIFQGRLEDGRRFHWTVTRPRIVYFVDRDNRSEHPGGVRRPVDLRDLRGRPVDAIYFPSATEHKNAREAAEARGEALYEADVSATARLLMEHFIQGSLVFRGQPDRIRDDLVFFVDPEVEASSHLPRPRLLSLDIECSPTELYCVGFYGDAPGTDEDQRASRVFMLEKNAADLKAGAPGVERRDADGSLLYVAFATEADLLRASFAYVREIDPDIIVGWNVIGFDLVYLERRCRALGLELDLGIEGNCELVEPSSGAPWIARIPGRAVLDGPPLVRSVYLSLPDYSLGTVGQQLLGRGKLIEQTGREKVEEINRQYAEDRASLARYNLEDAALAYDVFVDKHLAGLAVEKSRYTGLAVDRTGGSVAAFDFLYLPRLHRAGYVADTFPDTGGEPAPGGLVLDSVPGFFENVVVFDFKSLYPSIIRTFSVDPLAASIVLHDLEELEEVVKGPAGLSFDANRAILPSIIEELWAARDHAKAEKNAALSYAVKIIMNSFYGVLGSPGCRFFDPRLAGTITRIGHWILGRSRQYIEELGYRVIYGDTDSLFIHLGKRENPTAVQELGRRLSGDLNEKLKGILLEEFQIESKLVIEFETIYARFFMPTMRGVETGSKKRYAGWTFAADGTGELHFTGMESNRRDWTGLSHDFQRDLFQLIFERPADADLTDELIELVRSYHERLFAGELDDRLVYRKGLSKPLNQYTKSAPPHVRAARLDPDFEGRVVRYVMTVDGPRPRHLQGSDYDYPHYAEKQLAPIADTILKKYDLDYDAITRDGMQMNLF